MSTDGTRAEISRLYRFPPGPAHRRCGQSQTQHPSRVELRPKRSPGGDHHPTGCAFDALSRLYRALRRRPGSRPRRKCGRRVGNPSRRSTRGWLNPLPLQLPIHWAWATPSIVTQRKLRRWIQYRSEHLSGNLLALVGFFDETLLTNEDYEFNARIRKSGGKSLARSVHSFGVFRPGLLSRNWQNNISAMVSGSGACYVVIQTTLRLAARRSRRCSSSVFSGWEIWEYSFPFLDPAGR